MAAVLCQSISSLCSGLCSGCGTVCSYPCTACSSICKPFCEGIKKAFSSHFCIYVAVTLGLNIPPIAFATQSFLFGSCKGSLWLLLMLFFSFTHIIASFYLAGQSKSWNETIQTLCYDPWIAAYIVACIAFFFWLCIGLSWSAQGAMENGDNCPDNIAQLTMNSIYFGFSFLFFGVLSLMISACISMCRGRNNANSSLTSSDSGTYQAPYKESVV